MTSLRELEPIPVRDRTMGRILARQAARNGDKTYLLFEGRRYSYREVDAITTRVANGLQALGIRKGDHVALVLDNRPEILWLYFALGKLGGVSIPINTAAKGELLAYFLNQSDAVAIVLEAGYVDRFLAVQAQCPAVRRAVVLDENGPVAAALASRFAVPVTDYAELESGADTPITTEVRFNDRFCLFYTSGTTGPSKGNVFTHCNALSAPIARVGFFGYQREDILYVCLPLFHGNALLGGCLPGLVADATVALSRRFSASNFWKEVRAAGATKFNLLSAMVNILWAQPERPDDNDGILRQTTMVPIPEFGLQFAKRFNLQLTSVYSLTDYGNATVLPPDHPPEKSRSAGKPRPEMQVAILDDDDFPLPAGEAGEICLRANAPWIAAQGYYNMPQETLKAYRNLWFHTGDRGYFDPDGYLYFVDRKKDAMRRRGENISAWEVEQIISRHPAVGEVAVFPVRAEMAEDEVMATIVLRPEMTVEPAELIRFCQDNMAYFMVPRFLELVAEMPKTMTQKVQKFRLQEAAQQRLSEIWDREKAGIKVTR
ncbi:ATP-dependent acyl-CoA ligase [Vineibacter terrae]|uniref:ATP-dependent acyl-CoA ligase n=1 Tax=Vineibacter terrae TaxID=2586908 RepID=A0A5C8PC36_9HYPH|nr:AMP-binding protein [Vineibacter terrae]TXL71358.1 ATP-dependent acyl-CoA ligase [Vineibacter terrae]